MGTVRRPYLSNSLSSSGSSSSRNSSGLFCTLIEPLEKHVDVVPWLLQSYFQELRPQLFVTIRWTHLYSSPHRRKELVEGWIKLRFFLKNKAQHLRKKPWRTINIQNVNTCTHEDRTWRNWKWGGALSRWYHRAFSYRCLWIVHASWKVWLQARINTIIVWCGAFTHTFAYCRTSEAPLWVKWAGTQE